jgi:hypothetical protein
VSPTVDRGELATTPDAGPAFGPANRVFLAHSSDAELVANRICIWDDNADRGDSLLFLAAGAALFSSILTEQPATSYPLLLSPSLIIEGSAVVGAIRDDPGPHSFFGGWVQLPPSPPLDFQTTAQQLLIDVKAWTGWSLRTLADVLGVTHPTAGRILEGDFPARSVDAIARLHHVHDVLQRLWILIGRHQKRLRELIAMPQPNGTDSVRALLKREEWVSAYSLGLRLHGGDAPDMLAASPNASSLDATTFVEDASVWV